VAYSIVKSQGIEIVKLEGAVTIRDAQDLAATLREGLEDGAPVALDTAALEEIDTSILQLLYALRKTAPELSFGDPAEPFTRALERCGLRRDLLGGREDR
jgi:anti-anti-sigma regulatory factor